jgi:hypothetical protein
VDRARKELEGTGVHTEGEMCPNHRWALAEGGALFYSSTVEGPPRVVMADRRIEESKRGWRGAGLSLRVPCSDGG